MFCDPAAGGRAPGPASQQAITHPPPGPRPGPALGTAPGLEALPGWVTEHRPSPTPAPRKPPTLPAASPGSPGPASSPTLHRIGVVVQGRRGSTRPIPQPLCLQIPGGACLLPGCPCCEEAQPAHPTPGLPTWGAEDLALTGPWLGAPWGALPGPGSREP